MEVRPISENAAFDHVPGGIPLVLHKSGVRGRFGVWGSLVGSAALCCWFFSWYLWREFLGLGRSQQESRVATRRSPLCFLHAMLCCWPGPSSMYCAVLRIRASKSEAIFLSLLKRFCLNWQVCRHLWCFGQDTSSFNVSRWSKYFHLFHFDFVQARFTNFKKKKNNINNSG